MDDHDSRPRAPGYRTGRIEAFSDGVFAIAVTLLVLQIAVPAGLERTPKLSALWFGQAAQRNQVV